MARSSNKRSTPPSPFYSDIQRWLCFCMLALTAVIAPLFITAGFEPDLIMGSLYAIGLFTSLLLCFYLAMKRGEFRIINHPFNLSLFVLFAVVSLSIFWAHNKYEALLKYYYWLSALAAFILVQQCCQKMRHVEQLLVLLLVSGLIVAGIGILQYWFAIDWIPQAAPPSSTFANKNFAAQYITLTSPIALYFLLTSKDVRWQWLSGISASFFIAYIFYTNTRAAWMALAIQMIVVTIWFIFQRTHHQQWLDKNRLLIIFTCFVLLILLLCITPSGISLGHFNTIMTEAGTIVTDANTEYKKGSIRIALWLNSVQMFKDNWLFGLGLGNWLVHYPLYHQQTVVDWVLGSYSITANAHNDYLHYLAEFGLLGAIPALAVLFFIAKQLLQGLRRGIRSEANQQPLSLLLTLSLLGIATEMLFSFPMQKPAALVITATMLALLIAPYQQHKYYIIQSKTMLTSSFVICMGLFLLFINGAYRLHHSTDSFYKMNLAAGQRHAPSIIQYANETLTYLPWRHDIYYYLGSAYRLEKYHQPAVEHFEKALKSYPYHIPSLNKIHKSYLKLKQYHKAEKYLLILLATSPNNAEAHRRLGILYNNQFKDPIKAMKHLQKALDLKPDLQDAKQLRNVIRAYQQQFNIKPTPM